MTFAKFKPSETVDFAIVGSGAAGGVIARELSQAGFSVVVLEQGPRFTPGGFEHDELKYSYLSGITNDPVISPQTFRDDPALIAQRPRTGNSLIYARMGAQPIGWALAAGGDLPRWGADLKARLEDFPRSMMSTAHCTSLAVASNSVSIDPELKDAWGVPAMRVTYKDHPDDLATAAFLQDRAVEIMQAAGAQKIWKAGQRIGRGSVHLLGTCRMGNDPASSVVDKYHRSHDVPNLFLCDGSSFVTSGRGQPTMTIQALAFRAADHMARCAKRGDI